MDHLRFVRQALKEGNRLDLRKKEDFREVSITIHKFGHVEVNMGGTRIFSSITAEVVAPHPDRPGEGSIHFNIEFGPMAGPEFSNLGKPSPLQTVVRHRVEKLLKGSQAIDNEALCIIAGEKVWSLRVDIRAVTNKGNLNDASCIAALGALLSFRKADVDFCGNQTIIHTEEEREPLPLPIHHLPFPTTFALVDGTWIVDPSFQEESIATGNILIGINKQNEICILHTSGEAVTREQLLELYVPIATQRAMDLDELLQNAITKYEETRRHKRMKRIDARTLGVLSVEEDTKKPAESSRRKSTISADTSETTDIIMDKQEKENFDISTSNHDGAASMDVDETTKKKKKKKKKQSIS